MKVATIGTGFIVEAFLDAARQNDITCVAMYSRNANHASDLAKEYNVANIYTNLDDMLKQDDIDFVYVASPNSLHFEYTQKALHAGKHVICEKPFASTMKEFETVCSYAKEHNLFLFEAITTAHMPNYLLIKEQLNRLGNIRMVQCNFSQYSSRYDALLAGDTPNVFNPAFSGGALADISIYNLHFVIGLFGKPKELHYYPNKHANGIDTSGVSILEYDGFKAVCVGCKDTKSHCMAQIQGEDGYITMDGETSKCTSFIVNVNGISEDISQKQNDIALFYETKDFKKYFEEDNKEICYQLLDYSRNVMEAFTTLRKDGGIIYPADNR